MGDAALSSTLIRVDRRPGCAIVVAFDAVASTPVWIQHWSETFIRSRLDCLHGHGRRIAARSSDLPRSTFTNVDDQNVHDMIGICFGIFYIPATGSLQLALLMVLSTLTNASHRPVLLIADPPQRWPQPRVNVDTTLAKRQQHYYLLSRTRYRSTLTHTRFSLGTG